MINIADNDSNPANKNAMDEIVLFVFSLSGFGFSGIISVIKPSIIGIKTAVVAKIRVSNLDDFSKSVFC